MYDLVVLGSGSEGLSVALAAARHGARVAVVSNPTTPGLCRHTALVRKAVLIRAASLAQETRRAAGSGILATTPAIDFPTVMTRTRNVVAEPESCETDESLKAAGVTVVHGTPEFEAYDTVVVGGETRLHAQRFVIATGSRPAVPAIPGLAEAGALDENSFWGLEALPPELIILGGEATAVEFAQALARLGSKVTLLSGPVAILPREDPEVSRCVNAVLATDGIDVRTNVEVTRVVVKDGRTSCTVRDKASGASSELSGTHLLVATGRIANVEGLNLETVGIHGDSEHGIEVDEYLQTHSSRILAVGDVVQGAHSPAAGRQAAIVVQNAVLRILKKIDYSSLPRTTMIDPEVASVGLTEAAAKEAHPDVRVLRAEMAESARARIEGRTDGFAKLIATPGGKILGASVVAPDAALVLQEIVLAMRHGLSLHDIAETIYPIVSYNEPVHRLAGEFEVKRHDASLLHKALRWFHGYQPRLEGDQGPVSVAPANEHAEATGKTTGH